jgi:nucleotide-binding universal stress UspA family protein
MNILIAVNTDEQRGTAVSTSSQQAIAWGHLLRRLTGSIPTLLTVIKHESDRPQTQIVLERAARLLDGAPSAKIVTGEAVEEVVREAGLGQYDLLVMGQLPFRPIIQRILGSVTERVLPQISGPLLIAKARPQQLRRILLCEGGRDPSLLQRFATKLPAFITNGSEIKILHVMSQILANPAENGWELQADAQTLMKQHTPEGEFLLQNSQLPVVTPVPVATKVRHGLVVDEILAEAKNGRYDLIVIGQHRGHNWWLANLMDEIVTQADRSVLIL